MSKYIYLAARYSQHPRMRYIREGLIAYGFEVTSRWIDCHTDIVGDFQTSFDVEFLNNHPEKCRVCGKHDLEDIRRSDTLVMFSDNGNGKGGRHVELGYALALGKRVIVVGRRENVFHTVVENCTDVETLFDLLVSK